MVRKGPASGYPRFRYTLDNPLLSLEQRQFYEDNGFLVVPRLVDSALLDVFRERFRDLCDHRVPWGRIAMMKDISLARSGATGERLYYKAQNLVYDEVLYQYCLIPQVSLFYLTIHIASLLVYNTKLPTDFEPCGVFYWAKHSRYAHDAHQQATRCGN